MPSVLEYTFQHIVDDFKESGVVRLPVDQVHDEHRDKLSRSGRWLRNNTLQLKQIYMDTQPPLTSEAPISSFLFISRHHPPHRSRSRNRACGGCKTLGRPLGCKLIPNQKSPRRLSTKSNMERGRSQPKYLHGPCVDWAATVIACPIIMARPNEPSRNVESM